MPTPALVRNRTGGHTFPPLTFALTHRTWVPLALAALSGLLTAWTGTADIPMPTASGETTIPLWQLLTVGVGVLPALGLHSTLRTLEEPGSDILRRAERHHLLWLSLACFTLYPTISSTLLDLPDTLIVLRSLSAWLGVALVCGRLFGRRQSWAGPLGLMCLSTYWGDGAWWTFNARPYDDAPSLLLSSCLLTLGLSSLAATPWRLSRLLTPWRPLNQNRSPSGPAATRSPGDR